MRNGQAITRFRYWLHGTRCPPTTSFRFRGNPQRSRRLTMKTMVSKASKAEPVTEWDRLAELLENPVPTDVVGALYELGVDVIRECDKDDGMEVLASCPMHEARTGKADRHPSFWLNAKTG